MDYSSYPQVQQVDDQQQQHNHEYQQQQRQSYNPYQSQIYDSSQPYYSYHQQRQHYPYYPHDCHANSYAQLHYNSTHPPGVPLPPENGILGHQTISDPGLNSGFEPPSVSVSQLPHFSRNLPIGQTPYRGGIRSNRPSRGGRAHFGRHVIGPGPSSFRGRGRGRGGGGATLPQVLVSAAPPPPKAAFCELCRVDCNSREILEQHINGKRHKKNLQKLDEANHYNVEQQNYRLPEKADEGNRPLLSEPVADNDIGNDTGRGRVNSEAPAEEPERSHVAVRLGKRKMRGGGHGRGRGGKLVRGDGTSRVIPVEPPALKQVIPFACELCNIKCDTQAVLNTHLVGKKHQMNLKRFHSSRTLHHPPTSLASQGVVGDDPQLALAQFLMAYVLAQGRAPGSSSTSVGAQNQPVSDQNALTEQLRNQLQSLMGMCNNAAAPGCETSNRAANEASGDVAATSVHGSLDKADVVTEEKSGISNQVPGSVSECEIISVHTQSQ